MEILRPCCHAVDAGQGHAVNAGGTHAVEADNRDFGSEDVVCFYFVTY